jgi:glyceraldehyde 3-phosphate dehydrogenase
MRAAANKPNINIVAVNDPFIPVEYMEYMYKVCLRPEKVDA